MQIFLCKPKFLCLRSYNFQLKTIFHPVRPWPHTQTCMGSYQTKPQHKALLQIKMLYANDNCWEKKTQFSFNCMSLGMSPTPRTGCIVWNSWHHKADPMSALIFAKLKLLTVNETLARIWGEGLLSFLVFLLFFLSSNWSVPLVRL